MIVVQKWFELCERFDALVVRERLLLFGSCLAGLYLIFDTLFILPASNDVARLSKEISAMQSKIDQIASEKQVFDKVAQRDPDANLKRERLKLQGRLLQLEGQLDDLSLRLVPSDRFPEILQSVSEQAESVKLKSLKTLQPEAIDLGGKTVRLKSMARVAKDYVNGSPEDGVALPAEKVYRHSIRIRLHADYFDTVDFLRSLEDLKWRFYWEGLDYRVLNYPLAEIDIELYTLSTEEGLLGN